MMPFGFIDGDNSILWSIFTVAIAQVEQILVIETIAKGPPVVGHGFYQLVLAFQFLEGKYAVGMNHHFHLIQVVMA
jgi:hypothetical protein